jgi:DNA replication protein DnaC
MKPINPRPLIKDDFEDAIEQALLKLKSSTFMEKTIKNLQLKEHEIRENLATFIKLEEDEQAVHQCQLAGQCLKPQGHYVLHVKRNAVGHIERQFQPCPMLADQFKVSQFLIYDDFNSQWKDSKLFESLKQRDGQKSLYVYLMKVLQKQTKDGLALIGPHQSGKSYGLGIFAYRYALNELGTIGVLDFASQSARLSSLKRSDPTSFNRELERLQNLSILILDGLGSHPITEDMLSDFLIPIFLARQKPNLITMVTSTVAIPQLDGLFKGYKDKRMLMTEWLNLVQLLTKPIYFPAMMPL